MTTWKMIDSAPRDTFILLNGVPDFHHDDGNGVPPMVVGWWDSAREIWRFCSYDSGYYGGWENPTHWAELPTLPEPEPAPEPSNGR